MRVIQNRTRAGISTGAGRSALALVLSVVLAVPAFASEGADGERSVTVTAVAPTSAAPPTTPHGLPRSKLDQAANKLRDRQQYCFALIREQQKAAGLKDSARLAELTKQRAKVCNY